MRIRIPNCETAIADGEIGRWERGDESVDNSIMALEWSLDPDVSINERYYVSDGHPARAIRSLVERMR